MVGNPFPSNVIPQSQISGLRRNSAPFLSTYSPAVKGPDGQVSLVNNSFFPIANQACFTQNARPRWFWDFNDPSGGPLSRSRLQWVRSWYDRSAYDWTISPSILNHLQLGFNRQRNPSLSAHLVEYGVAALGLQGLSKN